MNKIAARLKEYLLSLGVSDVGFAPAGDFAEGYRCSVSLVVRLSDGIIDEIDSAPTHTYFNHYRTVNAFIDRCLLEAGLFLQREGYRYITVAASQSINKAGADFEGRYSHKKAACAAGLGTIGKSDLFLHKEYGPRVRLGTLFTDCDFEVQAYEPVSSCGECNLCAKACPAHAILGVDYKSGIARSEMFDACACSEHMKRAYQHIGRGAVCGICVRVCPSRGKKQDLKELFKTLPLAYGCQLP